MSHMKALFATALVCVAVQAQAQSWSVFGTGKWTGANEVTTTSDIGTYGGASLDGGPTSVADITALSFDYTANTNMNSGGSPRLVLMFSGTGKNQAELRPLTLTQSTTSTKLDGTAAGNNWDLYGGTCGSMVYGGTWAQVQSCFAGMTITEIFIVNDSGWVLPGVEEIKISAVNVNGIPFHPSKNDCKNGGYKDLGFANQGQCVSTFVQ